MLRCSVRTGLRNAAHPKTTLKGENGARKGVIFGSVVRASVVHTPRSCWGDVATLSHPLDRPSGSGFSPFPPCAALFPLPPHHFALSSVNFADHRL